MKQMEHLYQYLTYLESHTELNDGEDEEMPIITYNIDEYFKDVEEDDYSSEAFA